MAIQVNYITTATNTFLSLQSGLARPYWEVNITVSGDSSTTSGVLGQAYQANNDLISMGSIDREKPVNISGLSRIIAGDLTLTLDNKEDTYNPKATASIFTDAAGSARDFYHSIINVWAGFEDVSGTAYALQRGSFILTDIRIDGEKRVAYLSSQDAAKIPLDKFVGLAEPSGTAAPWLPPSGIGSKAIVTELLSAVGLSASQYDIASGIDLPDYQASEARVSDEVAKIAQANDGFVFTNKGGQVVMKLNRPVFSGTTLFATNSNENIMKTQYKFRAKDLVNKVQIKFGDSGDSRSDQDLTVVKGREQIITNNVIPQPSIAVSLASKLLAQNKVPKAFMSIDNIWLPSIELGDAITITDTGTVQTGINYEVYRLVEDIQGLKTKILAVDLTNNEVVGPDKQKWGFVSSNIVKNPTFSIWNTGTSVAPTFWQPTGSTGTVDRESTIVKDSTYSMKMISNGVGGFLMNQHIATAGSMEGWTGNTLTFHCWVKASAANQAGIQFSDGVDATAILYPGGDWQKLEVTKTIGAGAILVDMRCQVKVGIHTAYFDECAARTGTSANGTHFTDDWSSGFAFVCTEPSTAINPGFDADGNNNNVINTSLSVSGAGGTGIEVPFKAY